jgi:hypothetical protein
MSELPINMTCGVFEVIKETIPNGLDYLNKDCPEETRRQVEEAVIGMLGDRDFYLTIGIYPNYPESHYKTNCVAREHIVSHVIYNIIFRFGRTMFIDNICINDGMRQEDFDTARHTSYVFVEARMKKQPLRCSAPYQ